MKTGIKKIIIVAAAVLFVGSGVSFAHDRDNRPHRKAYGHYKAKRHHPGWNHKHFKPRKHHRKGYVYKESHHHRYYKNHHRRWKNKHFKTGRHHRKRYLYKEIHHHHYYKKRHHRRPPREVVIYEADFKDPKIVFKVILK